MRLVARGAQRAAYILFCFLHHFYQTPPLCFAQRACFHNFYYVSNGALIFFIMCMEFRGLLYELAVDRVLHPSFNAYSNGFIHLVADDFAGDFNAAASVRFGVRRFHVTYRATFLTIAVFTRAMSRRRFRISSGFAIWPIEFFNLASNSSLARAVRFFFNSVTERSFMSVNFISYSRTNSLVLNGSL